MTQQNVADVEEADVQQLISDLARAHRSPRSVEQFGIEMVPRSLRTARWNDLVLIWFAGLVNPGMMMLPGMAVVNSGLSFWEAVLAVAAGSLLGSAVLSVLSTFGPDYGLPGQMLVRSIFGITGTRMIVSILRLLCACYWFAFQTLSGALGIRAILLVLTGADLDLLVVSVLLGAVQAMLALFGFKVLQNAGRILAPVALFIAATILYVFLSDGGPAFAPERVLGQPVRSANWLPMMLWAGVVVGSWLPVCVSSSDISRYSRSRRHAWLATASGPTLGLSTAAVVGAYAAVGGGDWNVFGVTARLVQSGPVLAIILAGLIVAVLICNTMNLYGAGLSMVNVAPRLGRFWATLMVAIASIVACLAPTLVFDAQGWISELGRVFSPIAGVILADYLVLKRCHVDVGALLHRGGRYRYWHDVNWVALLASAMGYVLFGFSPAWTMPVVAAVLVTAIVYLLLMAIVASVSVAYREAVRPGDMCVSGEMPS